MTAPSTRSEAAVRTSETSNGAGTLEEQLTRLGLDSELGQVVRDGLHRLTPAEQAGIGSDLQFAFDALKPALAQLGHAGASAGTGIQIGPSVVVRGELTGSEDLTIDGQVEGKIDLPHSVLTIGPSGRIRAQVVAKAVIVFGEISGNVTASQTVDIRDHGSVDGDIASPRIAIAEGAYFRGSIVMQPASPETRLKKANERAARERAAQQDRSWVRVAEKQSG